MNSTASAGAVGANGGLDLSGVENGTYDGASIDLMNLMDQLGVNPVTDDVVDSLALELGAFGSTANGAWPDGAGEPTFTSEYVVAGADLTASSPAVAGVTSTVGTAITGVGGVLDAALGAGGTIDSIIGSLEALGTTVPLLGTVGVTTATISIDDIDQALLELNDTVFVEPLADPNGIVSIDLATGVISVNVAQLAGGESGLNGLPANTPVLDDAMITSITDAIAGALGSLTERVEAAVLDVLNNANVTVQLDLDVILAETTLTISGTLGSIAGTDPDAADPVVSANPSSIAGLPLPLDTILDPIVSGALGLLQSAFATVVNTAVDGVGVAVDNVVNPIVTSLSPLFGLVNDIVSLQVNEQEQLYLDGANTFTVNALSLELFPGGIAGVVPLNVDLASSNVRVSAQATEYTPTLDVTPTEAVPNTDLPVTGTGYPPARCSTTSVSVSSSPSCASSTSKPTCTRCRVRSGRAVPRSTTRSSRRRTACSRGSPTRSPGSAGRSSSSPTSR
ncbi:hypothetical protein GCM10009755_10160 [Brevibacterium samyangense]|uniref:Choice-of-anchor G family protein n=2 Tax=Brevibacterium samyangense TaxID=366888 RepID=A0ABP5ERI8_9MICO